MEISEYIIRTLSKYSHTHKRNKKDFFIYGLKFVDYN